MDVSNVKNEEAALVLKSKIEKQKIIKNIVRLLIKIVMLCAIYYIFFGVVFGVKRMETSFMSPNITEGDLLIYYRMDKNYELGDAVVVKNNKMNVYRIVAKAGQTVDVNEQGILLIDGYPEEHQAFYETKLDEDSQIKFPYTVEEGKLFVMNDYRLEQGDSRTFGTIFEDSVVGKIIGRLQVRNI